MYDLEEEYWEDKQKPENGVIICHFSAHLCFHSFFDLFFGWFSFLLLLFAFFFALFFILITPLHSQTVRTLIHFASRILDLSTAHPTFSPKT